MILLPDINRNVRLRLFQTVAQIGGERAQKILLDCLHHFTGWRVDLYHALHLCGFRARHELHKEFKARIEQELHFGIHLLYQIHWLQQNHNNSPLENALELELAQTQTRLLWLFSFVYDTDKIMRARNGFQVNKKESIANAQEIIDLTVPKEIGYKFNILFEQAPVIERMTLLKEHVQYALVSIDDLAKDILETEEFHYNHWTRAVVMHTMSTKAVVNCRQALLTYKSSTEMLLQETSTNALKKIAVSI
jgi:hypothetical protein